MRMNLTSRNRFGAVVTIYNCLSAGIHSRIWLHLGLSLLLGPSLLLEGDLQPVYPGIDFVIRLEFGVALLGDNFLRDSRFSFFLQKRVLGNRFGAVI